MAIQLPRDQRDMALQQIGQRLGSGIGGAVEQKALTGLGENLERQGVTPEGIFQRIASASSLSATSGASIVINR